MNDIDHMIAVMQAAKEGKTIQCMRRSDDGYWEDLYGDIWWDWRTFDFRVKPAEPRRIWLNIYPPPSTVGYAFHSRQMADTHAGRDRAECVEVVEVVK